MRRFWRNLPLGSRLTALSISLLTTLLGTLGSVLYSNLRRFLVNSTALRMRAQAKPVIERQFSQTQHGELNLIAPELSQALTSRDTTATIFDQRGKLIASGRRLPEEPVAVKPRSADLQRALAGEKEITYTVSDDQGRALVALIPLKRVPTATTTLGVVQLTTPLTQVDQILARQRTMLGLGVILTVGLGVLGELWLTRVSLRPLKRVIETIQQIAAGNFSQRVKLPHTGDEVGQLAAAFDQMAGNIETIIDSQSRFVSAAAHELRTPLTAFSGSLDVLQRGAQDDPAAMRSLLQGMQREVKRLNHLTEQLLSLTRLDASETLNIQRIDLMAFLADVTQKAVYIVGDRRFSVIRGPNIHIMADSDLLTQVLLNLIDNAVQHTDPQGRIDVSWKITENAVVLSVEDNGEGITPEDLPHIFETFFRGDRSRSRRQGGVGLGLAITLAIVHAHHGKIEVASQLGQGTRFDIKLPIIQP